MRTTLQIDDDVFEAAQALARAERKSIGEVVSRLARIGLSPRTQVGQRNGFPVFDVPHDAAPITPALVKRALEDD